MLLAEDLFSYIANELGYSQSYLSQCLGTSVATVSKWNKHTVLPSQDMYRTMLHFGKLMDVDCSYFSIELYIERVLEMVYDKEFVQCEPIDWETNTIFLRNVFTDRKHRVKIEDLTNKKIKF